MGGLRPEDSDGTQGLPVGRAVVAEHAAATQSALARMKVTLLPWFAGSNRITQRPELPSTLLSPCAGERVDRISQFDIGQSGTTDHRLPPCARQGTSDSTGPEVDIAKGFLRDGTFQADVRDGEPVGCFYSIGIHRPGFG